jgi:hypothetical protein
MPVTALEMVGRESCDLRDLWPMIVVGPCLDHNLRKAVRLPPGDPMPVLQTWKNRLARKMILRAYGKTLAQACGQEVKRPVRSPVGFTPEELLSVITDDLARLEGEPRAAELLGLTAEEIASRREHAGQAFGRYCPGEDPNHRPHPYQAMLSPEVRQVMAVVVAFVAGGALVWVPFSSAVMPFRNTTTYPVWVFLIATVCGSCPIVWSHGRRALAQVPALRSFTQEVLGYGVIVAALIVTSLAIGALVFGRGHHVETMPHLQARFNIVGLAVALAVAPSAITMSRIGAATRHCKVRAADLVAWLAILQSQLAALGAVIVLSTLTTATFRTAILAAYPSHAPDFPVTSVLLFGAWFTGILALAYVPPSARLRRHAQALVDRAFPVPDQFVGDWQQQLQRRRDLTSALRIDETSQNLFQNALIIGGPLITSALTVLILPH